MTTFGDKLRRLRIERGLSLTRFAARVTYDKGYISRLETGKKTPSEEVARKCDDVLEAHGDLIAAAHADIIARRDQRPWQTAELIGRIQKSDTDPVTIEALHATVFELGCEYAYRDAHDLRAEGHEWLRRVADMVRKPVGLSAHSELLTATGWLALLVGCLEYDMGLRTSAEVTRSAALKLGQEAGNTEIIGWAHEMATWFALTQGRYRDVISTALAAENESRGHSVSVQIIAQRAKAMARMGDIKDLPRVLERGHLLLDGFPLPERTDNHFIVDPAKWDFYAMDAYRLAGLDSLAVAHAHEVLNSGTAPDGTEIAPMRMAEARLTLAVAAARGNDLEGAITLGRRAFEADRKSLPSLLMVAGELDSELGRRFPRETETAEFRELVRSVQS
ncbi:helix-turn-helix domain-containing protein [Actinomadura rupiterrae]|uniref:helix-turn-helix domain-containing protein n=1 Tax=Actinomadura rupiterrae TaxID=559627 RepID=UPI0020A5ECA2|nr:helix-turn-helix transcriptional regulator [Actinomadura rupiterrae]MCP2341030.1 transcriptional regulator with XRE-family HTH domain [Actinomadura rupiterrae]